MSGQAGTPRHFSWKQLTAVIALVGVLTVFFWLNTSLPRLALFWVFGLALGFILQRSRFCFVSAVSDCFLFRDTRLLEGILCGLFLATLGFAFIMYRLVPDPTSGATPLTAIVSPFGWHLVIGGVLFGGGMMLSGGCVVGNLYRIGEGALSAIVAFVGIILGMGILQFTWPWWWQNYISQLPAIWLPAKVGWAGAIILTLSVITILFVIVRQIKAHTSPVIRSTDVGLGARLARITKSLFTKAWPLAAGGIVLSIVNILLFQAAGRPWTATGEIMSWAQGFFTLVRLPPPPFDAIPGT